MRNTLCTTLILITSLISTNTLFAKNQIATSSKKLISKQSVNTPLSPIAQAFLAPSTTTLAPENNIMFGILGLGAPADQDPFSYAKAILTFETEKLTSATNKNNQQLTNPTKTSLAWQGDMNQLCDFSLENCFNKIKDQASIYQTLANQNPLIIQRYQTLLAKEQSAYVMPLDVNAAIPTYKLAINANRLALHRIANELLSEQENTRLQALNELRKELKFWINISTSKPTILVEKMVSYVVIHRHLHLLGSYIAHSPQLSSSEINQLKNMLNDLNQNNIWDMREALHHEYKYQMLGQLKLNQTIEQEMKGSSSGEIQHLKKSCKLSKAHQNPSELGQFLYNTYFDGNELINTYATIFQQQDQALTMPKTNQAKAWQNINRTFPNSLQIEKKHEEFKKNPCLLLSNTKKINFYARVFYNIASPNYFDYVQRANDHLAYFNLVRAALTLRESNIATQEIKPFLEKHKANYQHPQTLTPINFDPTTKTLSVETSGKHNPQNNNFTLTWR